MSVDLLSDLTPIQREAVECTQGPLLVLAGAGSGKTRVITRRIAFLLQQGIRASNILAITFTNKASGEMRHRVETISPGNRVFVSTFHSLGARLLRQYADRLGIDKNFTIYDTDDRNKLVKQALEALNMDDVKFTPERIGGAISKAKNQLQTPKDFERTANDFLSQTVAKVYYGYEKRLRAANAMDFDDLLYLPALALRHNEELRAELDARFRYVLIDEYQDTNSAQYEIARRLSINYPNLCVVGDPDQNVYRWRGSDITNILNFERDFPGARVITLEQNFRSTQAVIAAANSLIAHNKLRKKKSLITENPGGEPVRILSFENGLDEAEGVVIRIKKTIEEKKHRYRDHAIFVRINALTRSLESAFIKHGVPFQIVKGLAFFERKENRDVLAYLRLIVNPADTVSFYRVVNEPTRGIGKTSLDRLTAYAESHEIGPMSAAGQVAKITDIKGKAATGLKDFARIITDLRASLELPPHEVIRLVLDKSGYRTMLKDSTDDDDADRLANIEELITAAKQFHDEDNNRTIGDFLEQIALASDVDNWDESADRVSVMTLHAAKGLEFPVVYMMATEQGLLPHERSLGKEEDMEEERRLCFVGITRAMKELYLCHSRVREFRGQFLYAVPSMFLDELPRDVERVDGMGNRNTARTAMEDWRTRTAAATLDRPKSPPIAMGSVSTDGEYVNGQVVQHDEYGIGQITDVSGYGALKRVKVRFPAAGEKTFVANKVKMKIVKRN